jgi:Uma2 family endonuclease
MTLAIEPSPPLAVNPPSFFPSPSTLKRFTVEQYHTFIQAGVFHPEERLELLEGWIVFKVTHNPLHDATVDQVQEAIRDRLSKDWRIRVQSAITTPDSEPEPDVVVARGPASRYSNNHPGGADIALVVEVADSSLHRDRVEKGPIYARAGVPEYWIVNLPESVVEVYSHPTGSELEARYAETRRFTLNDSIPLTIGGQSLSPIPVKEILP